MAAHFLPTRAERQVRDESFMRVRARASLAFGGPAGSRTRPHGRRDSSPVEHAAQTAMRRACASGLPASVLEVGLEHHEDAVLVSGPVGGPPVADELPGVGGHRHRRRFDPYTAHQTSPANAGLFLCHDARTRGLRVQNAYRSAGKRLRPPRGLGLSRLGLPMAVRVHRGGDRGVAELLLHTRDRSATLESSTGECVPRYGSPRAIAASTSSRLGWRQIMHVLGILKAP